MLLLLYALRMRVFWRREARQLRIPQLAQTFPTHRRKFPGQVGFLFYERIFLQRSPQQAASFKP